MHVARLITAGGLAIATAAGYAGAQQAAVPVHALSQPLAKTTQPVGAVFGLRHLPDGKLLVNDGTRRRVMVFDPSLETFNVTIDSAAGSANSYGPRPAPIIPWLADSTLFVDFASQSLLVIDPSGNIKRVMAAPKPQDLMLLTQSGSGVDSKGRLIYRAFERGPLPPPNNSGAPRFATPADSAPIVRADFETGTVDTIGRIKVASGQRPQVSTNSQGQMTVKMTMNPVPQIDEWALLSDGSVAFIRGHDYHIDWLTPDDTRVSTPKMPFDWRRLTDEDKQNLIDSARTARETALAARQANPGGAPGAAGGADAARMGTEMQVVMGTRMEVAGGRGGMAPPAGGAPNMIVPEVDYVPINEIPDYYPAIRTGAARADLDGNLWILPTTSAQSQAGELVYDVVNRKGELFQRVRVPAGRSIAGFGRGGLVYLMWRDGDAGWYVERTRILDSANVTQ